MMMYATLVVITMTTSMKPYVYATATWRLVPGMGLPDITYPDITHPDSPHLDNPHRTLPT